MRKRSVLYALSLIVLVFIAGSLTGGCEKKHTGSVKSMTIAVTKGPHSAPIFIAANRGFFEEEGIKVNVRTYASGKSCLKSMMEGKADLATVADIPIMHAGLKGDAIYVVATYLSSGTMDQIVARKDRGIVDPAGLRNKKIGVTAGTSGEYLLDTFLVFNNMSIDDVQTVNIKPNEMFDALVQGRVDAVSTWHPHVLKLQKGLGDNGVTFTAEDMYVLTFNLTGKQEYVKNNHEAVKSFARALLKADEFIKDRPEESRSIIAEATGMNREELEQLWEIYDYSIALKQTLLLTLENQARWAIRNKLTDKSEVPNYLDYIYLDALKEVKPEAVMMIH